MKRIGTFVALLALASVLYAACGDDDSGSSTSASVTASGISQGTATESGSVAAATGMPFQTVASERSPTPETDGGDQVKTTVDPVSVVSGSCVSMDHDGGGRVLTKQQADGTYVIQFAHEFTVVDGPALVVYLSMATELTNGRVLASDYINLGPLQSTSGFQEYQVPAGIDTRERESVIVWCEELDVGFVGARLKIWRRSLPGRNCWAEDGWCQWVVWPPVVQSASTGRPAH